MNYIPTPEELASGKWVWDDVANLFVNKEELTNPEVPVIPEEPCSENLLLRAAAYRAVSDPLFMEWQYDKTRQKEMNWRAAVLSIKTKYPL